MESTEEEHVPEFDPKNPLCPNVTRPNGETNPDYQSTFVFSNDFPALLPEVPQASSDGDGSELFRFEPATGTCRVMCFHPRSDLTIPLMKVAEIVDVINK